MHKSGVNIYRKNTCAAPRCAKSLSKLDDTTLQLQINHLNVVSVHFIKNRL